MKRVKKWTVPEIYAKVPMSDAVRRFLEDCERDDERVRIRDCRYLIRQQLNDSHLKHLMYPESPIIERVEERVLIEQVLSTLGKLSDYEQLLIKKKIFAGQSLRAIAREFGVHHSKIARQIEHILHKLYRNTAK